MATSSITHNFVISGDEAVQRFIDALDASEKDPGPKRPRIVKELTDPEELAEFTRRLKEAHGK